MWFGIIVVILAINFVTGFRSDISMSGHVSGFVVGAGVACILWLVYHFYDGIGRILDFFMGVEQVNVDDMFCLRVERFTLL